MTRSVHSEPPRVAVALLRACLPDGLVGDSVLGDLHAEYCARSAMHGRVNATAWYGASALRVGVKYLLERATQRQQYDGPGGLPSRPPMRARQRPGLPWLDSVLFDIRYASRTLRREPGWTAGAVCTLALVIGATTSIVSVVNAVLLKPLNYVEPEGLVALSFTPSTTDADVFLQEMDEQTARHLRLNTTYPNFERWQEATADVLENLAVFDNEWTYDVNFGAGTERLSAAVVSAGALRALAIPPEQGRWFLDEEDVTGSANAVILSHSLWQTYSPWNTFFGMQCLNHGFGLYFLACSVLPPLFCRLSAFTG